MKVLTLWEPWATLIEIGAKKIETRSWRTPYRGPIAIHAAKTISKANRLLAVRRGPIADALDRAGRIVLGDGGTHAEAKLHQGVIIATAEIDRCIGVPYPNPRYGTDWSTWPSHPERTFGDYTPGRFAWVLVNVRPLAVPIAFTGAQKLNAEIDDSIIEAARRVA